MSLRSRRDFLKSVAALPLLGFLAGPARAAARPTGARSGLDRFPRSVAVVGAGAFGGWTALWLRRAGAEVTLLDAWGPGNSRSSSGGESRVIRGMYGTSRIYVQWVVRSLELWREGEARWGERLYRRTGGLWMFADDGGYGRSSLPLLAEAGFDARELGVDEARQRYPQISFDGVRSVFFERATGYLRARHACRTVVDGFVAAGGIYRQAVVSPGDIRRGELSEIRLSGGQTLRADLYVFACGPWLGRLFPDVVGTKIRSTRQEVYYFGTPSGSDLFDESRLPVWVDFGERVFYGIPGNDHRGFKIADDTRGETVDPSTLERIPTAEGVARARRLLARRFPDLADAPLVESRVCQYENTPDGDFLIDRHPDAANVWIVGGGSGHGFKMGPAVGEFAAGLVLEGRETLARFEFRRFDESRAAP